jgi:mono/diheme cytochrome c family protein
LAKLATNMKTLAAIGILLMGLLCCTAGDAQMGMGGGPGMMGGGMMGPGMMGGSFVRRQFVMRNGVDPRYARVVNPLSPTTANIDAGRQLYAQDCAACHGPTGLGNGEAGKNLNPPPPNLVGVGRMPMATDGYLYWTIAEGGTLLKTAMPPFKSVLTQKQIWEVILFLRAL